jgi:5-hydroxyisourate hydrolase
LARVSTHVLDTSQGRPAACVAVSLYRIADAGREHCASTVTNRDGRTDEPLLSGDRIPTGVYELVFAAGAYLRQQGVTLSEPAFLDEVVIRFGVAEETGNYHVPLLLSPYGYSAYRGS